MVQELSRRKIVVMTVPTCIVESRMPTFYCIWPCEKCSYCNTLSTRKCENCNEPMRDEEQSLYLEDKNMLLAHNQRILTSHSSAGKGFLCFRAVDGPNSGNWKTNEEGTCDKQLIDSGIRPHTSDRGLRTRCDESIETECQISTILELAYETSSPHGSSVVDLAKETSVLMPLEQEKCSQKLVLVKEYGNESILSLDTEFEMYRKLNEMTLQQVASDNENKREALHQYIPEYKDSGTLDLEPFPDYYSLNNTESHSFADFLGHEESSPVVYPDAPNPAGSDQFAPCCSVAEEMDETLFISAITSAQRSFVHESNELDVCECSERLAGAHLVECKSIGISERSVESAFSDRNIIGPNESKLEQVEGVHNDDLQTELLLESVSISELCFSNQIEEFANDQSACSTSTDIESENRVPLVPRNMMDDVVSYTISKAEDASQNQSKQNSNTVSACESPDHPGWGNFCDLTAVSCEILDSDQQNIFDDSFVSAAGDDIANVTVADHNSDLTGQANDDLRPLEITECNRFINCLSNLTAFGSNTLIEGTCTHNQVKCEQCFNKGSNGSIIKVDRYVDVSTDFRTDFTLDKDTTTMIPVVDRADNTDITLMSKNRPTVGQRRKYGNVACNTKLSIVESTVKQQSTQTAKVTTEEKCINTILQMTDFDSRAKELVTSQCKTKLRKVLDELEELKKKYKRLPFLEVGTDYGTAVSSALQELKTNYQNTRDHIAVKEVSSWETSAKKLVGAKDKVDVLSDEPQASHYQHVGHKVEAKDNCENIVKQAKDLEITDWFDAEENFTAYRGFNAMQSEANNKDGSMTAKEDGTRSDASARIDKEIAETCYIYVDGLPRTVTEMELRKLFQKYQVSGIWLCSLHSECRCGVLRVASPNYAKLTVDEMNEKEYHGKRIKVHLAKISGDHMLSVLKNHSQSPLKVNTLKDHTAKDTNIKVDSQWESCSVPLSTRVINAASHKVLKAEICYIYLFGVED
ncbi:RNA-binding protein 44 [Mustelus asterias]